jgi:hypothetical protein
MAEEEKSEKGVFTFGRICKWPKLDKSRASELQLARARAIVRQKMDYKAVVFFLFFSRKITIF